MKEKNVRILLIEDDQALSMAIAYRLRKDQLEVDCYTNGLTGLHALLETPCDLVLLDRMLPGLEGVALLQRARDAGVRSPVLLLTAMDGISDRVCGLNAGADDYLVKPFAMDELMARVHALLRRPAQWMMQSLTSIGDLVLDTEQMLLSCKECSAMLSKREGQLLAFLIRNQGQVLPRNVLLDRVWGNAIVEEGNLDIYIHFLRKKLAEMKSDVSIRTIRGIGYQLNLSENKTARRSENASPSA
jgi:DNA-binding response OmpR family regulator